jgi:hypothetical protein
VRANMAHEIERVEAQASMTPTLEPPHAKQVILAMAGPEDRAAPSIRAFAREIGLPVERTRSVLWLQRQGLASYSPSPADGGGIHTYRTHCRGNALARADGDDP